jgi:Ca2+-binding EF-hand superfamily protein
VCYVCQGLHDLDTNENGVIDFDELVVAFKDMMDRTGQEIPGTEAAAEDTEAAEGGDAAAGVAEAEAAAEDTEAAEGTDAGEAAAAVAEAEAGEDGEAPAADAEADAGEHAEDAAEDTEAAEEDAEVAAEDATEADKAAGAEDAPAVGSREVLELEMEEAVQQKDYQRAAELQEQLAEAPAGGDPEAGVVEELVAAELDTLEATAEAKDGVIVGAIEGVAEELVAAELDTLEATAEAEDAVVKSPAFKRFLDTMKKRQEARAAGDADQAAEEAYAKELAQELKEMSAEERADGIFLIVLPEVQAALLMSMTAEDLETTLGAMSAADRKFAEELMANHANTDLVVTVMDMLEATGEVEDRVIGDSDLLELFKAADENKDGALDPAELTAALFFHQDLNLSPTAILDIVQAADVNNDGLIEFDEFVPVARKMMENPAEEAVAEYDPAVSGDKLDEYLQKQFKEYDANDDGALQTMEYIRLMRDCEFHFPDKLIIEVCIVLLCE